MTAPLITLLSDFGLQDGYVASMKGVILGISPEARMVDITHLIPPQEVRAAAFVLLASYGYFPERAVHVAVVDPGVGTGRRSIAIRSRSHIFVGPDNGIFSLVLGKETGFEARSLENPQFFHHPVSRTFHARDIFAPVAAHLACGVSFDLLGPVCDPVIPAWGAPAVLEGRIEGEIIHIDRFGNAVTNVFRASLEEQGRAAEWTLQAGKAFVASTLDTYGQAQPGELLILTGSSGFMEIAVNQGNAALQLGLHPGSKITFLHPDS
ncbi:MAG: S-adenosyl-l-methionine hydroxide adenosyltransferase family protein [Syntrophobacteraceae bacterium]